MGSVPTPAVCSQMTLVSVCDDSVPQSPHPHKGHDNSAYLLVFPCGLNKMVIENILACGNSHTKFPKRSALKKILLSSSS